MNEILRKYQKTHRDLKKEILPMKVNEHPELDYSLLLNEKEHTDFQHIIGVCKWLIFAGRFYLAYDVFSLSRLSYVPRVGHLEMYNRMSSYLKK